jgi:hypothetical protein
VPPQAKVAVFVSPDSERQARRDGKWALEQPDGFSTRRSAAAASVLRVIADEERAGPRRDAGHGRQNVSHGSLTPRACKAARKSGARSAKVNSAAWRTGTLSPSRFTKDATRRGSRARAGSR